MDIWTKEEEADLLLFLAEKSRSPSKPLNMKELGEQYYNQLGKSQRSATAFTARIRRLRERIFEDKDFLKNNPDISEDDKKNMECAIGATFQKMINWSDEEESDLLKFLAKKAGTATEPLNMTELGEQYYNQLGESRRSATAVLQRIIRLKKQIFEENDFLKNNPDISEDDKKNMEFAFGATFQATNVWTKEEELALLSFLTEKSRTATAPPNLEELGEQYHNKLGTSQRSARAFHIRILQIKNKIPGILESYDLSEDDKRTMMIAFGPPLSTSTPWTKEQHISLMKFLAKVSRTAKKRLSNQKLARRYFNGHCNQHHCITAVEKRIAEFRRGIPDNLKDNKHICDADREKIMFALGPRMPPAQLMNHWTEEEKLSLMLFLAEKSKDATGPLDTRELAEQYFDEESTIQRSVAAIESRIYRIRRKIPGNLKDIKRISRLDKKNMAFALGSPSQATEERHVDEIKQQMLDAFEKKAHQDCYPIVGQDFIKDFLETCTFNQATFNYNQARDMIYKHTDYDKFTKVRMMYVANTRITTSILTELEKDADVSLTSRGYIKHYAAHDKSFKLDRNQRRGQAEKTVPVTEIKKVPKEKKTTKQVVESDNDDDDMMARKASSSTRRHRDSSFDYDDSNPRSSSCARASRDALTGRNGVTKRKPSTRDLDSDSDEESVVSQSLQEKAHSPSSDFDLPAPRLSSTSSARTVRDASAARDGASERKASSRDLGSDSEEDDILERTSKRRHLDSFSDFGSTTPRSSTTSSARTTRGGVAKRKASTRDLESDLDEESVISQSLERKAHSPSFDFDLPAPESSSTSRARINRDGSTVRNGASKRKASTQDLSPDSDGESVVSRSRKRRPHSPSSDFDYPARGPSPVHQAPAPSIPASSIPASVQDLLLKLTTMDASRMSTLLAVVNQFTQAPVPTSSAASTQLPPPAPPSIPFHQESQGAQPVGQVQQQPTSSTQPAVQCEAPGEASLSSQDIRSLQGPSQQLPQLATAQQAQPEARLSDQHQPSQSSTSVQQQVQEAHPTAPSHRAPTQVLNGVSPGIQAQHKAKRSVKKPVGAPRPQKQLQLPPKSTSDQLQPKIKQEVIVEEEVEEAPQRLSVPTYTEFLNLLFRFADKLDCPPETLEKIERVLHIIGINHGKREMSIEPVLQSLSLAILIVTKNSLTIERGVKIEKTVDCMSLKTFLSALEEMLSMIESKLFNEVKQQVIEEFAKIGKQDKMCPIDDICTAVKMILAVAQPLVVITQ